ncbi:MAG TPA: hypothetical protein VGX92_21565 [Pyrinomonadaceae bacterium]|jgi:uncharacterized membrane protein|nr:hypothetical protein [Pyrinomonadaceae bacterium]
MADKSKYDTNPLDPDYARRTDDVWGARRGAGGDASTEDIGGATRDVARTPNERARLDEQSEAPTRRYATPPPATSYPSVFVPPTAHPPAAYGAPQRTPNAAAAAAVAQPPSSRVVPGINLPENVTTILPYIPFYIGAILAAVELFLVPRNEARTRFHAAQGLSLHLVVLVIGFLFRFAGNLVSNTLGGVASALLGIASALFTLAALIFFIVAIIRVWKGDEFRVAPLDDATRWLNEKIEPRK